MCSIKKSIESNYRKSVFQSQNLKQYMYYRKKTELSHLECQTTVEDVASPSECLM